MASNSTTDTETTTSERETENVDGATTETAAAQASDATADTSAESSGKPAAPDTSPAPRAEETTASATAPSGSFGPAALALVVAGLGLASLTGTSLGDMMRARQELLGQIAAATGGNVDQIDALYGSPWHTVALVNGTLALLTVILGAVLLGVRGRSAGTPSWVTAVAMGGTVLGVIGLLVSGGMYLDLFAATPQLPSMPGLGG